MSSNNKRDGLLSRWSRRKLDSAAESERMTETPVVADEQDEEMQARLAANREAAEAVDLSKLNEDSDISVFMKEGVPELLKRQALAALWRSSPVFSNVDGLVDYDDDFGSPDLILKTFESAYQAGRGYLKEIVGEEEGAVQETAGEASEPVQETPVENASGQVDQPDDVEEPPVEASGNEPDSETAYEGASEPEIPEMPKVSLRRRLMIDESG